MSDIQTPEHPWYHFLPVSMVIHAILLAAGWYCIPEKAAYRVQETAEIQALKPPTLSIVSIPADLPIDDEKAVDVDDDPFEETAPEIEVPPMFFKQQIAEEREPENAPKEPAIAQDRVKPQEVQAPAPPKAPEIETESPSAPPLAIESQTGEAASDGKSSAPQNEAAQGTAVVPKVDSGHAASDADKANGHAEKPQNAAPSTDESALWKAYTQTLSAHFKAHKHYPDMAKRLKLTGTVWLLIEISRDGRILSAEIAESSGAKILDEAALNSALKSGPVPGFPEQTKAQTKKLRIPYRYTLK